MLENILRTVYDGICAPGIRRAAVQIAIAHRDRPHSCGARGFDIATIVADVSAKARFSTDEAARGE